jgi:hypothetical protein
MRKCLQEYELKYSPLEKQAFSLVKVVSYFRNYILTSHVIAYVPYPPIKMMLSQQLREGRWANWLAKLQEYDIEIKPLKVVKGQGLCKLIGGIEVINIDLSNDKSLVTQDEMIARSEWYKNIVFYLKSGQFPVGMTTKERRSLKMKSNAYVLIYGILFQRNFDGMLLRCLSHSKSIEIMKEIHEGICGGHFAPMVTSHRIIRVGFYWPTLFRDVHAFVRKCLPCQKFFGKEKRVVMPLKTITVESPFTQWGLDVIGPINPKSSKGHSYIITTTDYFTKWHEAIALKEANTEHLIQFLQENILSRFGVPEKFITDNGSIFISSNLQPSVVNLVY